jgi:hypothetical protein
VRLLLFRGAVKDEDLFSQTLDKDTAKSPKKLHVIV